jgi:beta-lysine 5,6-aminomutase alpha subunit
MGLGHAFEINPTIKNGFLYEIAHAQLARQLFPRAPLKYMPPTKYKSTDVFQSHVQDTLFNMASVMTDQVVHLLGMHTEAIHTPLMQDRYNSLGSANYCFNTAASLSSEIEYKKGGIIETRANLVLDKTVSFLREVKLQGLMNAIGEGKFADIKRTQTGGKGLDGVFVKGENYTNPVLKILEAQNE